MTPPGTRRWSGVDKLEYDRPEDENNRGGRALVFVGLAVAVVVIFYFGVYR